MITQHLNFNVRFLIMLFFWTFDIFAIMHESNLSRPNDTGKFPKFFLRVRGDPNDEIDYKKIYILRFDFLIWSLKVWIWAFLPPISW